MVAPGARVLGGTLDVSGGPIFIGAGASVEPGSVVRGPAVIGERCVLRPGTHVRGDVVLGAGGAVNPPTMTPVAPGS